MPSDHTQEDREETTRHAGGNTRIFAPPSIVATEEPIRLEIDTGAVTTASEVDKPNELDTPETGVIESHQPSSETARMTENEEPPLDSAPLESADESSEESFQTGRIPESPMVEESDQVSLPTPAQRLEREAFELLLSGNLTEAQSKLDEALALIEETPNDSRDPLVEMQVRATRFAVMLDRAELGPNERADVLAYFRDAIPKLHDAQSWRHVALGYYTLGQIMSPKVTLLAQAFESYRRAIAMYDAHLEEDIIKARAYFFMGFMLYGRAPSSQASEAMRRAADIAARLDNEEARRLQSRARRMLEDMAE